LKLEYHPEITSLIEKAHAEQRKPSANDLGDPVQDSEFLNSLQYSVNIWIKEIQKVTLLDHEPGSGTTLQEVTFWVNLEKALNQISEEREREGVSLTMDALKLGKCFNATLAFDSSTGT
jgi:dynein heavy chain 1